MGYGLTNNERKITIDDASAHVKPLGFRLFSTFSPLMATSDNKDMIRRSQRNTSQIQSERNP